MVRLALSGMRALADGLLNFGSPTSGGIEVGRYLDVLDGRTLDTSAETRTCDKSDISDRSRQSGWLLSLLSLSSHPGEIANATPSSSSHLCYSAEGEAAALAAAIVLRVTWTVAELLMAAVAYWLPVPAVAPPEGGVA